MIIRIVVNVAIIKITKIFTIITIITNNYYKDWHCSFDYYLTISHRRWREYR